MRLIAVVLQKYMMLIFAVLQKYMMLIAIVLDEYIMLIKCGFKRVHDTNRRSSIRVHGAYLWTHFVRPVQQSLELRKAKNMVSEYCTEG